MKRQNDYEIGALVCLPITTGRRLFGIWWDIFKYMCLRLHTFILKRHIYLNFW